MSAGLQIFLIVSAIFILLFLILFGLLILALGWIHYPQGLIKRKKKKEEKTNKDGA